jgi:predicted ATPase/DNA-binding SARP family transcriptional activator
MNFVCLEFAVGKLLQYAVMHPQPHGCVSDFFWFAILSGVVALKMFGTPQVRVAKRWETLPLEKSAALLFYVVAHPDGVSRGTLAGLLWSDTDDSRARANLRQLLTRVRRQDWSSALEIGDDFLFWRGESDLWEFWQTISGEHFEQYTAEFLEGFLLSDAPEFMDWLELERQTIRNAWRENALGQAKTLAPKEALELLRLVQKIEPLCEEALQALMRVAVQLEQPELGRNAYAAFAKALHIELGLEPLPETKAQYIALETTQTPAPKSRVLGLPAVATPFIGRETELTALEKRLEAGARCLVLVAAGGMGKTRLALRVAWDWQETFPDGVVFASMLGLQGEAALSDALLAALSVKNRQADTKSQLLGLLESRHTLLVLDNLESDTNAAASLIHSILERCPQVRVLATSRERLGIHAEEVFELGVLSQQAAESLFVVTARRADSRLTIDDSQQAVVGRIAKHCGYMPLALELAASWAAVLSLADLEQEVLSGLDELESRFSDTPERHKSIRAVFGQTWVRLAERLRRILGLLAPLEGGFSLAMARGIAGANLRDVETLIARSLLSRHGERYAIHELLRQCVQEQPETDTRLAQNWILKAVQERQTTKRRSAATLHGFEEDMINIRTVLLLFLEQGNFAAVSSLVSALDDVYDTRGLSLEAKFFYQRLRHAVPTHLPIYAEMLKNEAVYTMRLGEIAQAETLFLQCLGYPLAPTVAAMVKLCLAQLMTRTGRWIESEQHYKESLEIFVQLHDHIRMAECHNGLGINAKLQGNFAAAQAYLEQALSLNQAQNHFEGVATATLNLANVFEAQGKFELAKDAYEKCLTHFSRFGHKRAVAVVLNNLSIVQRNLGELENANTSLNESLRLKREMHDKRGIAVALQSLAELEMHLQNPTQARVYLLESIQIALEASAMPTVMQSFHALAGALEFDGQLEQAALVWRAVAVHPATSGEIRRQIEHKALPNGRILEFQELLQSVVH